MRIEAQLEAVAHLPVGIEAQRAERVLLLVALLFHAEVLRAIRHIAQIDWGGHGLAGIEGQIGKAVGALQPDALLAALFANFVGRVGVIQGQGQAVGRCELHHRLAVHAFALEIGECVAQIVGHAIQLADRRGIGHHRVRAQCRVGTGPTLDVPGVFGGLDRTAMALLVAGAQADTEGLVRVGIAEDARHFRGERIAEGLGAVGHHLGTGVGHHAIVIERLVGLDIDRRTDTAAGRRCAAGLEHLDAGNGFGGELGEVERARADIHAADRRLAGRTERIGTGDQAAVEGDGVELRAEAACGDLRALAITALDGNASDALERFGQVGVRKLADVFGADRIHHAGGIALDAHRLVETVADTGHVDGIQGGGGITAGLRRRCRRRSDILRKSGIDDQQATNEGEHGLRLEAVQRTTHRCVLGSGVQPPTAGIAACDTAESRPLPDRPWPTLLQLLEPPIQRHAFVVRAQPAPGSEKP